MRIRSKFIFLAVIFFVAITLVSCIGDIDPIDTTEKYIVSFNPMGGSSVNPRTNVPKGSKISPPVAPTKDGYEFLGWFKESECINEWIFAIDVVNHSLMLYAKWGEVTISVTFESNGGSNVDAITNIKSGDLITKPADPKKDGRVFAGWYKEATFVNEWDFAKDCVTGSITLYAKWVETTTGLVFVLINNDTEYEVSKGSIDVAGNCIIPDKYEGLPVTSIGNGAFSEMDKLYYVWMPDSITEIKQFAFRYSTLKTISLSPNITKIGNHAFGDCKSLEAISLPEGLTTLGSYAFMNCEKLSSLSIPARLTSLPYSAFAGCVNLKDVVFPATLAELGGSCFANTGITNIYIPDTITITENVFDGAPLAEVTFESATINNLRDLGWISSAINVTILGGDYIMENFANTTRVKIKEIVIPDTIKEIKDYAFVGQTALKKLTIKENITKIGFRAFSEMGVLDEIIIEGKMSDKEIEGTIFYQTSAKILTMDVGSVSINALFGSSKDQIEEIAVTGSLIPSYSFSELSSLKKINISSSVQAIESGAFSAIGEIDELIIPNTVISFGLNSIIEYTIVGKLSLSLEYTSLDNVLKGETSNNVTELVLTGGSGESGAILKSGFNNLQELTLPEGLKILKADSFDALNTKLKRVVIPRSVETIENSCFGGASNYYIEFLNPQAIDLTIYTTTLKGILVPKEAVSTYKEKWSNIAHLIHSSYIDPALVIEDNKVVGYTGLATDVEIPFSMEIIAPNAFKDNLTITSITLASSVTVISTEAFSGCINLKAIYYEDIESVLEIGYGAFKHTGFEEITLPFVGGSINSNRYFAYIFGAASNNSTNAIPSGLKKVTIDSGSIPASAFANITTIESIVFTNRVTNIGTNSLTGMTSLVELSIPFIGEQKTSSSYISYFFGGTQASSNANIPASLKTINITNSGAISYDAFNGATNLTNINLNEGITSIGSKAFYNCNSLVDISIPNSVKVIYDNAFEACKKLKIVNITDNSLLEEIRSYAFKNCIELEEIYLPSTLTSIGANAFEYCAKLSAINLTNTKITTISNNAFNGCGLLEVVIPKDVTEIGSFSFANSLLVTVIFEDNSKLTIINEAGFLQCMNLVNIELPEGLEEIGDEAFIYSDKVLFDRMPTSLVSIGKDAFNKTNPLSNSYDEANGIVYIGNWAIGYLDTVGVATLRSDTVGISSYAFADCATLTEITLAESLIYINNAAFVDCRNLIDVKGFNNTKVEVIDYNVFRNTKLTQISFPASLKEIKDYAFMFAANLVTLTFANESSLKIIGGSAFYGTKVSYLTLPEGVESIGDGAFEECVYLYSVKLPVSLKTIGANAFKGATELHDVHVMRYEESSITQGGVNMFSGCNKLAYIYVPTYGVSAYRAATYWSAYSSIISGYY